jgi:hypothetical protein
MPQSINQEIPDCYALAAECRRSAETAATPELRAEFLEHRAALNSVSAELRAQQRARDYFAALKGEGIKTVRAGARPH